MNFTSVLGNFSDVVGSDVLKGQLLENLLGALADVSRASEDEGQWTN